MPVYPVDVDQQSLKRYWDNLKQRSEVNFLFRLPFHVHLAIPTKTA